MLEKRIKTKILQRIDTKNNWESLNPTILTGEIAFISSDNGV